MPVKDLIAVLRDLDEYVAAPGSYVEEPVINRLYSHLGILAPALSVSLT